MTRAATNRHLGPSGSLVGRLAALLLLLGALCFWSAGYCAAASSSVVCDPSGAVVNGFYAYDDLIEVLPSALPSQHANCPTSDLPPADSAFAIRTSSTTPPEFVATNTGGAGGEAAKPDLVKGDDRYIEGQTGETAHEIKNGVVGPKNGSKYDLYIDKRLGRFSFSERVERENRNRPA